MIIFSDNHLWLRESNNLFEIGLTPYIVKKIGPIMYIDFFENLKKICLGDPMLLVESSKAAIEIDSPLNGNILKTNKQLVENIHYLNKEPLSKGWLLLVEGSVKREDFMDEENYFDFVKCCF